MSNRPPHDLLESARASHRAGDLAAAALYEQALTADPKLARAAAGLGVIALQSGRTADALERLGKAAALDPADPAIQNNLGNAFMLADDLASAETAFDPAVNADPRFIDALYNRAVARQRLRRRAEAEADYVAVLARDPARTDAAVNLAALYREAENPLAGITVLEQALTHDPGAPDALIATANLQETVDRTDEAAAALELLPSERQTDPQAVLIRARLDLRKGDTDAGLQQLTAMPADALPQPRRQALYLKGLLLDRAGRTDAAFAAFRAGNDAMRASRPDAAAMAERYRRRIAEYERQLTDPPAARPAHRGDVDPLPFRLVFFCGFPRSGTAARPERSC